MRGQFWHTDTVRAILHDVPDRLFRHGPTSSLAVLSCLPVIDPSGTVKVEAGRGQTFDSLGALFSPKTAIRPGWTRSESRIALYQR
jgi:hypothetical protein